MYDRYVTGNMDRELETLEAWAQTYPRDPTPHSCCRFATRSPANTSCDRRSREVRAIDYNGGSAALHSSKAYSELYLNRLDAAEATIRRAEERKLASDYFLVRYFIAFVRGDGEGMRQQAAIARASRSTEDLISHLEALRLAGSARLQDARRTAAIAVAIAKQSGRLERAALFEAATAVWEALYGNRAAARQKAAAALALGRGHEVDYAAAFALAVAGDVSRSRRLPTIWPATIRRTRRCNSCIFRRCGPCSHWTHVMRRRRFNCCRRPPASTSPGRHRFQWVLRQALSDLRSRPGVPGGAAAGRGRRRVQRIVDHRSIVLVDPIDALARLQLAGALALSGDTVKAKSVYNDLLTLWKNADPDIRVLKEAQADTRGCRDCLVRSAAR